MADYSVLLPGQSGPATANQAAASDFNNAAGITNGADSYTLDPITVTGIYTDAQGNPQTASGSGSGGSLAPVAVTASKLPVPFSLSDWFAPPKLFLTLGAAVALWYLMKKRRKS